MLARTSIWWLCLAVIALAALFLRWRSAEDTVVLFALLILPVITVIVPIVAWGAAAGGWRIVAARPAGPVAPTLALTGIGAALCSLVSLAVCAILLAAGLPAATAGLTILTTVVVGTMLATFSLWLTMRAGTVATLAVGVIGLLLALLVGGTGMQDAVWPLVPWSWALYTAPGRLIVTISVSAALTGMFVLLIMRTARRVAA